MECKKEKTIRTTRRKQNLKKKKNKVRLRNLWDNFKHTNIQITGCYKEKRKNKKLKTYLKKIMKENFPDLEKEIDIQVQEAQRVPNKMHTKRNTLRYIIIKMSKVKDNDKERILKAAREKQIVTYNGVPIRLTADFT